MEVHKALGPGFLESIYRNGLQKELALRKISASSEAEVEIVYKNTVIGRHRFDLFVQDQIVVELKAVSALAEIHTAQVLSYLKAAGTQVGLVINFGEESLTWRRLIRKC